MDKKIKVTSEEVKEFIFKHKDLQETILDAYALNNEIKFKECREKLATAIYILDNYLL